MPPRSRTATRPTPGDGAPAASTVVRTDQRPEGWDVGNRAPGDKYAPVGADGQPDLKKISDKPVKGYGVQLVVAGATVTQENRYDLGLDDRPQEAVVRTTADSPQGVGQVAPS